MPLAANGRRSVRSDSAGLQLWTADSQDDMSRPEIDLVHLDAKDADVERIPFTDPFNLVELRLVSHENPQAGHRVRFNGIVLHRFWAALDIPDADSGDIAGQDDLPVLASPIQHVAALFCFHNLARFAHHFPLPVWIR